MSTVPYSIRLEQPADAASIEALNDIAFGPGRHVRSAYRLRDGVSHDPTLSFVGEVKGTVMGSVRLTPIRIGGKEALLLGPLAVAPEWTGQGCGRTLVRTAVDGARKAGHALILLVGDEPYYGPLGFKRTMRGAVTMPGPVDPDRVLVAELKPGAAEGLAGPAERAL
jgi:predicted N-acetyltransferase YhbS